MNNFVCTPVCIWSHSQMSLILPSNWYLLSNEIMIMLRTVTNSGLRMYAHT